MALPAYLTALNLSAVKVDYTWETVNYNRLWAVTDEDNPRLMEALLSIGVKAAFAEGIACAEWVVARVTGHVDTTDALLRIEAAWASTLDRGLANLPAISRAPAKAVEFGGPLRLAMNLLSIGHESLRGPGRGVRRSVQGLGMLVDYIAGRHPAFGPWFSGSLRKLQQHYPKVDMPAEQQPPVPIEFFNPDFVWRDGAGQASLERFVGTLNPANNPYFSSP